MRRFALGLLALSFALVAPAASADDALVAPPLSLTVSPGPAGGPWALKVENTGELPVRIAADARLLVLEVTASSSSPNAGKKGPETITCKLPEDARPATDDGSGLVIPAKRAWTMLIDPLFYCFDARERHALVNGATITAHFGWPAAKTAKTAAKKNALRYPRRGNAAAPSGPFAALPVGAAIGKIAPARELLSPPFTLTEDVELPVAESSAPMAPGRPALRVTMPESRDVARGVDIDVPVTATNEGTEPALLLFRPETIRFEVKGPQGSQTCGGGLVVESPIRELYGTIGVKGHATQSLLLDQVCDPDLFDEPGVYRVTATLDTTSASARSIGMKTWDGTATAKAPMLLRVRTPRRFAPPKRPTLD